LDALDNIGVGRKSGEYFGFRVVEVHEDGCPHWHIALFCNDELGIIETIEESISRLYSARGGYYEAHKEDIVRVIKKTGDDTASPSSYIFGYVLKALSEDASDISEKYKCAIRAMGARQYSFFGIKCATGKQRALKKVVHLVDAPSHIAKQARSVHTQVDNHLRNESQLAARVDFFEHGAQYLTISKIPKINRYGDIVYMPQSIRHDLDDVAVTISPMSEDISQEAADKLRRRET
jgi:hypothetical protein